MHLTYFLYGAPCVSSLDHPFYGIKMRKYVYLAGPIFKQTKGEANNWREWVKEQLGEGIVGISPLRCEPLVGRKYKLSYDDPRFGTPNAIAGKNFMDVQSCDITLAYFPEVRPKTVSYGTIIEMGWALALKKPLIVVTEEQHLRNHPMLQGMTAWCLPDLESAVETIQGLLGDYVNDT